MTTQKTCVGAPSREPVTWSMYRLGEVSPGSAEATGAYRKGNTGR